MDFGAIRVILTMNRVYLMIKYVSEQKEKTEAKIKFDNIKLCFLP
jgi:hypothetical protein